MADKLKVLEHTCAGSLKTKKFYGKKFEIIGDIVIGRDTSWGDTITMHIHKHHGDIFQIRDACEDEELYERVLKYSKEELVVVRNLLETAGLLEVEK